jgi:coniferyl-alcohol glucosyltransferase
MSFHMLKYVFVSSAWPLALMLYLPILDKEVEGEYVDEKEPIRLPGCKPPVRPKDVLVSMMDRTKQDVWLEASKQLQKCVCDDGEFVSIFQ